MSQAIYISHNINHTPQVVVSAMRLDERRYAVMIAGYGCREVTSDPAEAKHMAQRIGQMEIEELRQEMALCDNEKLKQNSLF